MKERSLPNQYLLLETLKRRFNAEEKPLVKTGMERARELAEQSSEYRATSDKRGLTTASDKRSRSAGVAQARGVPASDENAAPISVQDQLWGEEAA